MVLKYWTIAAALVVLVACDTETGDDTAVDADESSAVVEADDHLRTASLPDDPDRIVSMAPNTTEVLFELDVGDRIVATTRYCDWPEEARDLPSIGGMLDPDHEAIMGAEPDLVIGSMDGLDPDVTDNLDRIDVPYGFVAMDDVDSVRTGIERLGKWLNLDESTAERLRQFDDDLQAASADVDDRLDGATRTLLVVDRDPVVAAGPDSFGDDLLEAAGLTNALDDDVDDYPILDAEQVLQLDPELIVDVTVDADEQIARAYWEELETLQAVEDDRVVHLDDSVMLRPGPRIPEAVRHLGRALEAS